MTRNSGQTRSRSDRAAVSAWRIRAGARAASCVTVVLVAGCALEVQNTQPAREVRAAAQPPGSIYLGWRVFQDRCARCHGPDALGTPDAPDLTERVRTMDEHRFLNVVLYRYEWSIPAAQAAAEGGGRAALIEQIAQRRAGAFTMPEWSGEPRVEAHIVDLHAYLSARAHGRQAAGRPTP